MTSTLSDNHPPGGHPPTDLYGSSRQVQILTMVLTAINIFAAVVMAARILWDTRTACMERRRRLKKDELPDLGEMDGEKKEGDGGGGGGGIKGLGLKMEREISTSESSTSGEGESDIRAWWEMIPTIDLFPLILAVTIFLQGTMLAVVEGEGWVREPFEGNCRFTSEIAWVGEWSLSLGRNRSLTGVSFLLKQLCGSRHISFCLSPSRLPSVLSLSHGSNPVLGKPCCTASCLH